MEPVTSATYGKIVDGKCSDCRTPGTRRMARPADVLAAVAKANAVAAKPVRLYAQNAKAFALMAEVLEQRRSEPPPFLTSPAELVVYVRVMNCRQATRPHVSHRMGRRGG